VGKFHLKNKNNILSNKLRKSAFFTKTKSDGIQNDDHSVTLGSFDLYAV